MNIPKHYDTPLKEDGDLKHDTGKLRYDLIPPETLKGLASVLTYGAAKYADWNWIKSTHPERYYSALMRHLESWRAGELTDDESGLPALEHVLFCAMALHWFATVKGMNMNLPYQEKPAVSVIEWEGTMTMPAVEPKNIIGGFEIPAPTKTSTWQPQQWQGKDADAQL